MDQRILKPGDKHCWNAADLLECILWRRTSHLMGFIQIGLHNPNCNKDALCSLDFGWWWNFFKCINFFSSSGFLYFIWLKSILTNYAELKWRFHTLEAMILWFEHLSEQKVFCTSVLKLVWFWEIWVISPAIHCHSDRMLFCLALKV